MLETMCPRCGKGFKVHDDWLGKQARCHACRQSFIVQVAPPPFLLTDEIDEPYELAPLDDGAECRPSENIPRPVQRAGAASDPGQVRLSAKKLDELVPGFFTLRGRIKRLLLGFFYQQIFTASHIQKCLYYGDSRAAVVVSRDPLLVAAYTDEFDATVLLRFSPQYAVAYQLELGSRLLAVFSYWTMHTAAPTDIERGPDASGNFCNAIPLIADFLSDDRSRIELRKRQIDESEWQRAEELGDAFMWRYPGKARNGSPLYCHVPCVFKIF